MIKNLLYAFFLASFLTTSTLSSSINTPYRFAIKDYPAQKNSLRSLSMNNLSYSIGSCSVGVDAASGLLYVCKAISELLSSQRLQKKFVQTYSQWSKDQFQEEALKKITTLYTYGGGDFFSSTDIQRIVLAEHHLYQFEGFRELIKTFPDYESYIQELHQKVSYDSRTRNRWWNDFPGFKHQCFTDVLDMLCWRINDAQRARKKREQDRVNKEQQHAQEYRTKRQQDTQLHAQFLQKYAAEHAVEINESAYRKNEAERFSARVDAIATAQKDGYQFTIKSYVLSHQADKFLYECSIDKAAFISCDGSAIQQQIHTEMIAVLDQTAMIHSAHKNNQSIQSLSDTVGIMTYATIESNHAGRMHDALALADCCWAFLDYGKAVMRGMASGAESAVKGIIENPIETAACAVASEYVLAYHIGAVLYNVFDISITYVADAQKGHDKWHGYTAPLRQLVDAITDKERTLKEKIQGGAHIATYLVAQSAALGSINRLCKGAQRTVADFVKNNPFSTPEQFAVTPDGLMCKVAEDVSRSKPRGKFNAWSGGSDKILRAHNMKQFFNEFEFGKLLKNSVTKTNKRYKGQTIYQINREISGDLQKGYEFYLDSLHYDHLEIFDKKGHVRSVFNLNGVKNIEKTDAAIAEARRIISS